MPHHESIDGAILLIKNRIRVVCIMKKSAFVMKEMIQYFEGDIKRINHLIKVFGFAKTLGELERIDSYTQEIIEIAALTHDIGIKKVKKSTIVLPVIISKLKVQMKQECYYVILKSKTS